MKKFSKYFIVFLMVLLLTACASKEEVKTIKEGLKMKF